VRQLLPERASAHLIGAADSLWKYAERFPDVRNFVDPNWDPSERPPVADYLVRGTRVNRMRGLSHCRFCKQHHGSAEADTTWRVERDQEHTILHLAEVRESVREGSSQRRGEGIPWGRHLDVGPIPAVSGLARGAKA